MSYATGYEGKLYWGSAGSTPAAEITGINKVKVNAKRNMAKLQTRAVDADLYLYSTKDLSLDIEAPWNSADTGLVAIRNAFRNKTAIGLKALDASAGTGADGDWVIESHDLDQPLTEGQTVAIHAVPAANASRVATLI